MRVSDLRFLPDVSAIDTDVCIIGSGAAGMTIAGELSGRRVLVLESGGVDYEDDTQALTMIESSAQPRTIDQYLIRRRALGGSTTAWSGRCAPFDPIDYVKRAWVPHSGWPIEEREVEPYFARAASYLQLHDMAPGMDRAMLGDPRLWEAGDAVRSMFWQASQNERGDPVDFGRDVSPDVDLLLHANVVGIDGSTIAVSTLEGRRTTVRARAIILCCGGVENARLMLACGLGNDNVGRYLMDHIDIPIGPVDQPGLLDHLGYHWLDQGQRRYVFDHGLRMTAEVQEREGLLNCHGFILESNPQGDRFGAMKRLARARRPYPELAADVRAALRGSGALTKMAFRRAIRKRPTQGPGFDFHLMLEQAPYRESRIVLSETRDALGMPLARLHWITGELERSTVERAQAIYQKEFEARGLRFPPRIPLDDAWIARTTEKAHPTGTTRMAADPADGVVDAGCEVHGHKGLYVAGSSVFSTAGAANPTFMIVSLALRLADRLKAEASEGAVGLHARYVKGSSGYRVGLIGASKRAREIYAPVLAYLGHEIVGYTARTDASAYRLESRTGAPRFADAGELAAECDLLIVSVSDSLSEQIVTSLVGYGTPMLCETPLAWKADGVRRIIALGGARLGVAEQFPFAPVEEVRRALLPRIGRVREAVNDGLLYSYHGIAQLRRYIAGNPVSVRGDVAQFDDGAMLVHRERSDRPSLRVIGERGEINDQGIIIDGRQHAIVRSEDGSVELAGERWQNPYPGLDDEQIGVARLIEAMKQEPLYSAQDFLTDIELVQALRYAKRGIGVDLPLSERRAKMRMLVSPGFWRGKSG